MGKTADVATGRQQGRNGERQVLAQAIAQRDQAEAGEKLVSQARLRARDDQFKANRAVEDAERALLSARETARLAMVDAYVDDDEIDGSDAVADAEAALTRAQRRQTEMKAIAEELGAHKDTPGHSIPNIKVDQAVCDVVKTHPTVRRLVEDYCTARSAFQQYEATLIWLAVLGMIPDDLKDAAPSRNATRYADPDPAWLAAVEALKRDPDAALPA